MHAFARTPLSAPGVTLDVGAILKAGAIVLKDVKPWMIIIENTARD
jgi:acetyltransferase-like isoleucine patch superfamily enzyme